MALGKRVKQRRTELGLTQEQVARAIGKPQSVIQSIESRDSQSSKHAASIAKALGVTLGWLSTGAEPMLAAPVFDGYDRRTILRKLIDERYGGNVAEFARAIKKAPAQVHQWLSGHRKLGDAGASHIENAVPGLWQGYFDGEPNNDTRPTAVHDDAAKYIDSLLAMATPKSREILDQIANDNARGLLTDEDIEELYRIAGYLKKKRGKG